MSLKKPITKLLIIKLHAFGDLVIATPAIRRLREGLPDAQIDLLTVNWTAPAVMNSPHIDNLIISKDELFFKRSVRIVIPLFRLIARLRREQYQGAVIFHRHRMMERFANFVGIPNRFGFHGDMFLKDSKRSVLLDENRHSAVTAWELADLAVHELGGVAVQTPQLDDLCYEMFITKSEKHQANIALTQVGLESKKFVSIFPGGAINPQDTSLVRRWSVQGFVKLTQWLTEVKEMPVLLMGANSDKGVCAKIANKTKAIDVSGNYNLRLTAAITQQARLAVSNDSGPLHMASAVGIPVIGLFGPTGASYKLPPGSCSFEVSAGLPCSPCYFTYFKGCIFDSMRCQEELTVDKVTQVLQRALDTTSVSPISVKEPI